MSHVARMQSIGLVRNLLAFPVKSDDRGALPGQPYLALFWPGPIVTLYRLLNQLHILDMRTLCLVLDALAIGHPILAIFSCVTLRDQNQKKPKALLLYPMMHLDRISTVH